MSYNSPDPVNQLFGLFKIFKGLFILPGKIVNGAKVDSGVDDGFALPDHGNDLPPAWGTAIGGFEYKAF